MKAYRLLSENELRLIQQKRVDELGNYFARRNGNTHKYKNRERYMHFFLKREDCDYIRKIQQKNCSEESNYIAEFNIPLSKIIGHIGKGFYETNYSGYDSDFDVCYELAIPISIFNPAWLKFFEQISLDTEILEQKQSS